MNEGKGVYYKIVLNFYYLIRILGIGVYELIRTFLINGFNKKLGGLSWVYGYLYCLDIKYELIFYFSLAIFIESSNVSVYIVWLL